jgi:hypothetical protein
MGTLLETAREYKDFAATKANAYYASAEYYARAHTRLGVAATAVTTLVGTTVVTSLVSQFGIGGNEPKPLPTDRVWIAVYAIITLLSIAAPVLTGLQAFLRFAERSESYKATAAGYDRLRQRLDVFLLRHGATNAQGDQEAYADFEKIVDDFGMLAGNSLTIPDSVYDRAAARRRVQQPRSSMSLPS